MDGCGRDKPDDEKLLSFPSAIFKIEKGSEVLHIIT